MPAPQNRSYSTEEHSTLVLYDLRIPGALKQARDDREAWGKQYTDVYRMGLDHVLLVFRPGGARRFVS